MAGKTVGISLFTWLAVRARVGLLPGAGRADIVGVAGLGGIGFTVSIFVSGLAFESEALQNEAKIGILAASILAGLLGTIILDRMLERPAAARRLPRRRLTAEGAKPHPRTARATTGGRPIPEVDPWPRPSCPPRPSSPRVEEERLHRKQRLAAAFRLFARFGFDEGVAGHITARDPEHPDHFWVNPFGMHFGHIRGVRPDPRERPTARWSRATRPVNRAAFAIHSQVHAARPDVVAAAHAHSLYGKTWSSLGRLLDPITQDACAFYEDHALFDDYTGVVLDTEEGKRIAARARRRQGGRSCATTACSPSAHTVDEAAWWFITMERSCQAQLLAEAAGHARARSTREIARAHRTARSARTTAAGSASSRSTPGSSREQPDLLD